MSDESDKGMINSYDKTNKTSTVSTCTSQLSKTIKQFKLNILMFPSCFIEVEENELKLQNKMQKEHRGDDEVKR